MDRLTLYLIAGILTCLGIAGAIIWKFGFLMLIRIIFSLGFLGLSFLLFFFLGLSLYARNFKYALYCALPAMLSSYATYLFITWQNVRIGFLIFAIFIIAGLFLIWYISEPDIGIIDRFKSAERLERERKYKAAARKYEKKGDYVKAADMYIKLGWLESAAWAYERTKAYDKAAKIYEKLYSKEKDTYYLKEAHECWKKAKNMERAAKALEKYAKEEPWFWEDVAKLYEKIRKPRKAKEAWQKALDYYLQEVKEEGVFWEDVAKIYEKLGNKEKSREAYEKFLEYCINEAKEDEAWWKHVAETYEKLGKKEKAKEAWKKYKEYKNKIQSKMK